MTRGLRSAHRHATRALALGLPIAVASVLALRPDPMPTALPDAPSVPRNSAAGPPWAESLSQGLRVRAWITAADSPSPEAEPRAERTGARAHLEVEVGSSAAQPELLLYWTPAGGTFPVEASAATSAALRRDTSALPGDAVLLGQVGRSGRNGRQRFTLPGQETGIGALVVYDLAHGRIVATLRAPIQGRGGVS